MTRLSAAGRSVATNRTDTTRASLKIAVGDYTGTGSNQTIPTSFSPNLIMIQGTGGTVTTHSTAPMGSGSAISLGSATGISSTTIVAKGATGFTVGTNSASNSAATQYFYVVVGGAQDYFRTTKYTGDGNDNRQLTTSNLLSLPDVFWTRGGTNNASGRFSAQVGDDSLHFAALDNSTDEVQSFVANGVELGISALVNAAGTTYYATAFRSLPGVIASGQYTGNGVSDRLITTGIDTADLIIVKAASAGLSGVIKTSSMAADTSYIMTTGGSSTIRIKNSTSTGFTVGTSTNVNGDGTVYNWFALKAGNFNVPITRNLV